MEKFVYIMSKSQTKRVTSLYHISSTYNDAIRVFYEYHLKDRGNDFLVDNRTYWSLELYKFPVDHDYTDGKITTTSEKLSKSSKYRIKFKDWKELREEYKRVNRTLQIDALVD